MVITDLIFVHVLIVDLKRVGWQLLCFVQFPIKEWGKKRINMWNSDNEIYCWKEKIISGIQLIHSEQCK